MTLIVLFVYALFCHGCYNLQSVGGTAVLCKVWGELLGYCGVIWSRGTTGKIQNILLN